MTTANRQTTLRRGLQMVRADVLEGRDVNAAIKDAGQFMTGRDFGFLTSIVGELKEPENVAHQCAAYLLQSTDWIVVEMRETGEEIRHSFPCDPQAALQALTEYTLQGKQARLITD